MEFIDELFIGVQFIRVKLGGVQFMDMHFMRCAAYRVKLRGVHLMGCALS